MSKASDFAKALEAASELRPPNFKCDGKWFAHVTNDGGIEFRSLNLGAEYVPAFVAWLKEQFDDR